MQLVQHKKEAYWFYYFLSNFYDNLVNPLFWTVRMREESLDIGKLDDPNLKVIDVGSGTGFTTQGIVKRVPAHNVFCVDQSHQQMAKAKAKPDLQDCTFRIGDAENIPYPDDTFDRYVSAGSIEYWPDPQRGVDEAFRVVKPGGTALLIGPIEPGNPVGRFFATTWMLFPPEKDYFKFYEEAGFENIRYVYVDPHWFTPGKTHFGIAIAGDKPMDAKPKPKPAPGDSVAVVSALKPQDEEMTVARTALMIGRVALGSLAGFIFIPIALVGYLVHGDRQKHLPPEMRETLNTEQKTVLGALAVGVVALAWWLGKKR